MLKSANDVAEISRQAKELVAISERALQKEAEHQLAMKREKELTEQERQRIHAMLQHQAVAVAQQGGISLVVTDDVNLQTLRDCGLDAKLLVRRESLEQDLTRDFSSLQNRLVERANFLVSTYPGRWEVAGDKLLHRNPLISLMESNWYEKGCKGSMNYLKFWEGLGTSQAIAGRWLEQNKADISTALKTFEELKLAQERLQDLTWRNSMIPVGFDSASYIFWWGAQEGDGLDGSFSATWLKWLSVHWVTLAKYLQEVFEMHAKDGNSSATFAVAFSGGWEMKYWGEDSEHDRSEIPMCSPVFLIEELHRLGYKSELQFLIHDDDYEIVERTAADEEHIKNPTDGDCYELHVKWD